MRQFTSAAAMLLLKTRSTFIEILDTSLPLGLLPASRHGDTDEQNKRRANDLAVTARIEGFGVTAAEGRWAGSEARVFFVLVTSNESQVVGFCRRMLEAASIAALVDRGPPHRRTFLGFGPD